MSKSSQLIQNLIIAIDSPLREKWDELITDGTDRSKNRSPIAIDEAYRLYVEQRNDDLNINIDDISLLGEEIYNSREAWVNDNRSTSLFWSATDQALDVSRAKEIFEAARKNSPATAGNFFNRAVSPGTAPGQLIRAAEELLYEREKVLYTQGAYGALTKFGYYEFTDGRVQNQALEEELNNGIADAYFFYMWIRSQIKKVKDFKKLEETQKIKGDDDYTLALLITLDQALQAPDESIDPDLPAQEVQEARSVISTTRFNKQQYLLQNLDQFANRDNGLATRRFLHNKDSSEATGDQQAIGLTQNRVCQFINSHKNAVNKLNGMFSARRLFDATTEELSKLVPRIKIYKVLYDEEMNREGEVEIKFPTKTQVGGRIFDYNPDFAERVDTKNPTRFSKTRRDYGIQNFSWKYNGSDPFAVDRDIEANLELYFQDFSQFTALRGLNEKTSYRYLDLIVPMRAQEAENKNETKQEGSIAKNFENGGPFNQDIRVEAGWEVPSSASQEFANAVKKSQINFVLTPMDYSLSFAGNGNGSVVVSIQYRARIESVGKNRLINVIAADKEDAKTILKIEKEINETDEPGTKKQKRIEQKELYKQIRKKASQNIIEKLIGNGSVYWRTVDIRGVLTSAIGSFQAKRTFEILYPGLDWGNGEGTYKDGLELALDALNTSASTATTSATSDPELPGIKELLELREKEEFIKSEKIIYTFFGDIVQVAAQIACDNDNFLHAPKEVLENFKVATLDFKFGDATYNLANMPIEMGVFSEFLYNSIGKRDIQTKSIISFLSELLALVITNRIDNFLNLEDGSTRSFKIGYQEMTDDLLGGAFRFYDLDNKDDIRELNSLNIKTKNGVPRRPYLIIYADNPLPSAYKIPNTLAGYNQKKREDEKEGLLHLALGSTKSLIKNISFDRKDIEYAREQRLTLNQEDPYALLTNVFNVTIDMFGNNFFKPGSYIYVDPKVVGGVGQPYSPGSIANVMGLGGYHIVTSVSHTISGNSYSTSIEALFETSGDGLSTEDKLGISKSE